MTIGDFWGYEKVVPKMNTDNKGISLVICNTDKGVVFLGNVLICCIQSM
ncbi:hypothetical protein SFC43_04040 [Bacteroides sp. CR5/BHMF/2]|nr:hypothetical protein [Bacteroides sp. CR5/BHMF/2]